MHTYVHLYASLETLIMHSYRYVYTHKHTHAYVNTVVRIKHTLVYLISMFSFSCHDEVSYQEYVTDIHIFLPDMPLKDVQ